MSSIVSKGGASLPDTVFISYASEDSQKAQEISEILKRTGLQCWIAPDSILPGERYPVAIANAIRNCCTFLLLFSGSSDASDAVMNEIELATRHRKRIVPVRLENTEPHNLAYYLGASQWVEYFKPGAVERLQSIVRPPSEQTPRVRLDPTTPKARPARLAIAHLWSGQIGATLRIIFTIAVGSGSFYCVVKGVGSSHLFVHESVGLLFGAIVLLWQSRVGIIFNWRGGLFLLSSIVLWIPVDAIAISASTKSPTDMLQYRGAVLLGSALLPFAQGWVLRTAWRRVCLTVPSTYLAFEASHLLAQYGRGLGGWFGWVVNDIALWQLSYILCMFFPLIFGRPSETKKRT